MGLVASCQSGLQNALAACVKALPEQRAFSEWARSCQVIRPRLKEERKALLESSSGLFRLVHGSRRNVSCLPLFDGADKSQVGHGAEKIENGSGDEDLPIGEIV